MIDDFDDDKPPDFRSELQHWPLGWPCTECGTELSECSTEPCFCCCDECAHMKAPSDEAAR